MPSSPSSAACLKNRAPSQSAWSLNWIGERGSGSISFRRAARLSMSGVRRRSWAVKVQEIEGKEHDAVRRLVDGPPQGVEVGDAVLVLDNGLTINQGRFAGELAGSLDHPAIWPGPVPATAGEGPDLAAIDDDQCAVAVVLDLVNPAFSGAWFRHECRDFRPYEAER